MASQVSSTFGSFFKFLTPSPVNPSSRERESCANLLAEDSVERLALRLDNSGMPSAKIGILFSLEIWIRSLIFQV